MTTAAEMRKHFELAIDNVTKFGDTDIFPFPAENIVFTDCKEQLTVLLLSAYSNFDQTFELDRPSNITTIVPVGYLGFRAATQQDPFWNTYLLALVISISSSIEAARMATSANAVFSYRLAVENSGGAIFRDDISWRQFSQHSTLVSDSCGFVVVCDISDCYQRIYHHRLENALTQLRIDTQIVRQIMAVIGHLSGGKSYGLPVGGPAARILVELVLNLTDQLLRSHRVQFCRYADDYCLFVTDIDQAYERLVFLSEKLLRNDGLSLQKSKTRIVSSAEFRQTQSILSTPDVDVSSDLTHLFSLNLRYDPYSDQADEDYATLKSELRQIDIIGLLNRELAKTKIHSNVIKRVVSAVRHLDQPVQQAAIRTLVDNLDNLYPVFPVIAFCIKACYSNIDNESQLEVSRAIINRVLSGSHLLRTPIHAAYAVRVLSERKMPESEEALVALHERFPEPLVRRDIILAMAKWGQFYWLTDKINEFQSCSPWERRAFIVASHRMGDNGSHWRKNTKSTFTSLEILVRDWASRRPNLGGDGEAVPI